MSDDQTPDDTDGAEGAPDPADVQRAVVAAAPDTGHLFAQAIFASFFHQPMIGMGGAPGGPVFPQFGASPVQQVATALWERHGEQAKHRIVERVDVDDVIERVAERVHQRLVEESEQDDRFRSYRGPSGRDLANSFSDVQRIVREKLAEKLSERQMAAYDAEQQEMRAAWEREQQRMREQPAELDAGTTTDEG